MDRRQGLDSVGANEREKIRKVALRLKELGDGDAVRRFVSKYGSLGTKAIYLDAIALYFRWLRKQGTTLTPDELITDNLKCIYESKSTEVATKRRHTDWLDRYVNGELVKQGVVESTRHGIAAAVKMFYRRNDSPLFGDFQVQSQAVIPPPKALAADEIRAVLKALTLEVRLPLLIEWQSGIEINRVLGLKWGDFGGLETGECPVRLTFYGRKKHRRTYSTFVGRDSIETLKLWREKWKVSMGKVPGPLDPLFPGKRKTGVNAMWLNRSMKEAAAKLAASGLIKNGVRESWHSHALRHSFESEASHAGVRGEIRNFLEGHIEGITWVYNHGDELHPEDLIREYLKIEPFVSLSLDATQVRIEEQAKHQAREQEIEMRYNELKRDFESFVGELQARGILAQSS